MTHYVVTDLDDFVLRVHADESPEEVAGTAITEFAGWTSWPAEPFQGAKLKLVDGALTWHDPRALEKVKEDVWEGIKLSRAAAIEEDLVTPYGVFQCRPDDRQNLTDSIILAQTLAAAGQPVNIDWTLADNSVVTLTAAQLTEVGLLLGQKIQAAHTYTRTLRAVVDAATTPAEVLAVTWSPE